MRAWVGVVSFWWALPALAEVPEAVETSLAAAAADAVAVAVLVLLAWVAFLTVRLLRKPLTERELDARHARREDEADRYLKSMEAKANPVSRSAYKSGPF